VQLGQHNKCVTASKGEKSSKKHIFLSKQKSSKDAVGLTQQAHHKGVESSPRDTAIPYHKSLKVAVESIQTC
jgi:hypothetical protein